MLYYVATVVKPEIRCIELPGQEAAHALESLVESGVRFAVRLRPDPNLPVDGALSCGNGYPQGTAGGHQHRSRPGIGARLSDGVGRDWNVDLLENLRDLLRRLASPLQPGDGIASGIVLQENLDGIDYFGRFFS